MSILVFLLIFLSALLHASWNFLSKKSVPSAAFFLLLSLSNTVLWSWTLFVFHFSFFQLPPSAWAAYLGSIVCECAYMIGLAYAYRKIDISQAYPMIRALPVLMIAAIGALFSHTLPSGGGFLGLLLVSAGCLFMPLKNLTDFHWRNYTGHAMKFVMIAAIGTTGYTMLDALVLRELAAATGAGKLGVTCLYLFWVESGIAFGLLVYTLSNRFERRQLRDLLRHRSWYPSLAGLFSSSAYLLVLIAMLSITELSYLQAFRQISLPLGMLFGILFLKERSNLAKWVGVTLIVAGLVTIAFQPQPPRINSSKDLETNQLPDNKSKILTGMDTTSASGD